MKVFSIFLSCTLFGQNIIFVHLGNAPPPCIYITMQQARFFNEKCDIYLLTDNKLFDECHLDFFEKHSIQLIDMSLIPITNEHLLFRESNPFNPSISNGFWLLTTERFFTLFDFIQDRHLEDIVHLENDTMLYINLNELLPIFWNLETKIAAPFQSLKGCIPCFVYIKDEKSLSSLISHMLYEIQNYKGQKPFLNVNDMQTLGSYHRKFGNKNLLVLPTLMPEYRHYHSKLESRYPPDNATTLSFLSSNAYLFPNFIFDAAGIGIYFNGNDNRFFESTGAKTIHARCLFNPGLLNYYWKKDECGRIIPYLNFRGTEYKIINLHFHSKKPEEYTSYLPNRKELP